jgi:hypothetical protein
MKIHNGSFMPRTKVASKPPKGVIWRGTWAIQGNLLCPEWKEILRRPCLKYNNENDSEIGKTRVKTLKAVVGN